MNTMLEKKTTWRSEPMVWMLIALPLTAVIASGVTIWFAATNADTLVTEEHVKDGLAVSQVLDRDRRAAELGISAGLDAAPGRLTLHLQGRLASAPKSLVLTLSHPSDPLRDMVLLLESSGDSTYSANYAAIPAGKRHLELAPADKAWRITGQWQAPFTGSTRLSASTRLASP